MNRFTSRQRKLLYAVGIVVLLGPIVYLGFPSPQNVTAGSSSGLGKLSQLRHEYSLGEATLGAVDPSSSAMNLVLLGLRGPAASLLHLQAIEYQERKQWAKLRTTVDSIILLQPHYVQIWKFQGWNLAYNVSREWDKVDDRFYWVKEGIKFLKRGTGRNNTIPILEHDVGEVIDKKMSVADEKKFFRRFFVQDPDDKFKDKVTGINGPDVEINNEGIDGFLVARKHFQSANVKDDNDGLVEVKGMTHVFFRQGPAKSLMNYADHLTKDGNFFGAASPQGEGAVAADAVSDGQSGSTLTASVWKQAYDEWMNDYGKYPFLGRNNHKYILNSTEAELVSMAQENGINVDEQRSDWNFSVNMVNYRHWRDYAEMEADPVTIQAHRTFVEAKKAYAEGRGYNSVSPDDGTTQISEAQKLLEQAMDRWVEASVKYPKLFTDFDLYLNEALLTVRYWKAVHQNNGTTEATDYPLKAIWESNAAQHLETDRQFLIESRSRIK